MLSFCLAIRVVESKPLTHIILFLDTVASDSSEYQINVNFGFSKKNEVSFLYTMITERMPDYCQVFRAIPLISDWESGLGGLKLDGNSYPLEAETSSTTTGVEVHMSVPGGEEGVLAFICALEDCLMEYDVEFREKRRRGGEVLYYKLFST
jgi:hypothetical protein